MHLKTWSYAFIFHIQLLFSDCRLQGPHALTFRVCLFSGFNLSIWGEMWITQSLHLRKLHNRAISAYFLAIGALFDYFQAISGLFLARFGLFPGHFGPISRLLWHYSAILRSIFGLFMASVDYFRVQIRHFPEFFLDYFLAFGVQFGIVPSCWQAN